MKETNLNRSENSHSHSHQFEQSGWRLLITILLNFVITIAEIVGGIVSGSLSLISDAMHNFSDGISVILSYFAIRLNRKPKNLKYTFGYKRAEILVAVFNSAVLIGISLYLLVEAYHRFRSPAAVKGDIMILIATIGLTANVIGTLLLRSGAKENMNIRSAYLHLFSDALSSVGVILGGIFIYFFKIVWIDPLLTVLISIYIIKESYVIVKEAVSLLMMASPPQISISDIEQELQEIDKIDNIHHIHLWRVNEKDVHFEAHAEVAQNLPIGETTAIIQRIEQRLHDQFSIDHVTIQFECGKCKKTELV